jgi:hypothetical protein
MRPAATVVVEEQPPRRLDGVEMPVQTVGQRRHPQVIGFRDGLAVAVVVLVVAFAGNLVAIPAFQPDGMASSASAQASTDHLALPRATAAVCEAGAVTAVPTVTLQVAGGRPTAGLATAVALPVAASVEPVRGPASISVTSGDEVELRIADGRCAVAWEISLDGQVIERQLNPTRDPAQAAQAAFRLQIFQPTGRWASLTAHLAFEQGDLELVWRVMIARYPGPAPTIVSLEAAADRAGSDAAALEPGCGVSQAFLGGGSILGTCHRDGPLQQPDVLVASPDATIAMHVDGWAFERAFDPGVDTLSCGHLDPATRVFTRSDACELRYAFNADAPLSFRLGTEPGTWAIAVNGCFADLRARACGTWYAIVDVESPSAATGHPGPTGAQSQAG